MATTPVTATTAAENDRTQKTAATDDNMNNTISSTKIFSGSNISELHEELLPILAERHLISLRKFLVSPLASVGTWITLRLESIQVDDFNYDELPSTLEEKESSSKLVLVFVAQLNLQNQDQLTSSWDVPLWWSWWRSDSNDNNAHKNYGSSLFPLSSYECDGHGEHNDDEQDKILQTLVGQGTNQIIQRIIDNIDKNIEEMKTATADGRSMNVQTGPKVKIMISAVHRTICSYVEKAFESHVDNDTNNESLITMKPDFINRCSLYSYTFSSINDDILFSKDYGGIDDDCVTKNSRLEVREMKSDCDGSRIILRQLMVSDAETVNDRWAFKSETSLSMVHSMIESDDCCCLGLEVCGGGDPNRNINFVSNIDSSNITKTRLFAWILQYKSGPLGMLWCEEEFRKKGYGKVLVLKAMELLKKRGDDACFAYIVDGNHASENLFCNKLGWQRICSVDWIRFVSSSH